MDLEWWQKVSGVVRILRAGEREFHIVGAASTLKLHAGAKKVQIDMWHMADSRLIYDNEWNGEHAKLNVDKQV